MHKCGRGSFGGFCIAVGIGVILACLLPISVVLFIMGLLLICFGRMCMRRF